MRRLFAASIAAITLLAGCSWADDQPPIPSSYEGSVSDGDSSGSLAQRVTFTIPEGYTLARIALTLEEEGLCSSEEFLRVAQNEDFSDYPLIAEQKPSVERCFRLEGYLFPDTYEVYSTDPPDVIIRKMLDHTEQKITADMRSRAAKIPKPAPENGSAEEEYYTIGEIITLASVIEKEAFGHEEMGRISSVLHNRLNAKMMLQCDVTINYVEGAIKPFIDGDKDRYNDFYNTYKCPALPAGPICNPGMDAINAALSPDETDFFYFVTDDDKNYYYATTFPEHQQNEITAGIGVDGEESPAE